MLRLRFLLSFLLVWSVVGSLFAVLLSSAGPVFYGQVTGLEDPFAELMGYLAAATEVSPVWALNTQDMLWTSYQQNAPGFGHGISAMPSVHVALAVQLAIMGWHSSKSLGLLLTGFALMIQIGSVHLGYHYAIDGYLGALLAGGIRYAVGPLSRRLAETVEISEPRLEGFGELAPVLRAHSD